MLIALSVQDGSDVVVDGEHVLVDCVNRFHALSVQDGVM